MIRHKAKYVAKNSWLLNTTLYISIQKIDTSSKDFYNSYYAYN